MSLKQRLPLMWVNLAWYSARGVSGFVLPLYLSSIGMPLVEIGIALGIGGVSLLVFELAWGFAVDRVGVKKTLPVAEGITILTFLAFPFVNNTYEAYVGSFLLGMTSPVMIVVSRTLVVGETDSSTWGAGFGMIGASISLGFAAGALLGGSSSSSFGYAGAFYLAAILSFVPYPLYAMTENTTAHVREGRPMQPLPSTGEDRTDFDWRTLVTLSLVSIPVFMGTIFYTSIMQLVVTETPSIGAGNNDAALMIFLFSFSNVIFQPLLGSRLAGRARTFISLGLFLNFCIYLVLTQAGRMIEFDGLAIAEAFVFSMISPLSLSLLMVKTPKKFSGRMMGGYGAAEDVGIILGPVVGTFVWANFGLQAAYLAMGVPMLAALLFYLVASRE